MKDRVIYREKLDNNKTYYRSMSMGESILDDIVGFLLKTMWFLIKWSAFLPIMLYITIRKSIKTTKGRILLFLLYWGALILVCLICAFFMDIGDKASEIKANEQYDYIYDEAYQCKTLRAVSYILFDYDNNKYIQFSKAIIDKGGNKTIREGAFDGKLSDKLYTNSSRTRYWKADSNNDRMIKEYNDGVAEYDTYYWTEANTVEDIVRKLEESGADFMEINE